jgi:hypothetical protein
MSDCKYYKKKHPVTGVRVLMMPQETKEWLGSLVNKNGGGSK